MSDMVIALIVGFLAGLVVGFTVFERISRPVMEDYDRLLAHEAREVIRGKL